LFGSRRRFKLDGFGRSDLKRFFGEAPGLDLHGVCGMAGKRDASRRVGLTEQKTGGIGDGGRGNCGAVAVSNG
jgi:hypothetical protein